MTYQVTDDELRQIPGCTPLKIYIVLNNSPNGMTAAALSETLHIHKRTAYDILREMRNSALLCKNGSLFCGNPHKNAENPKEKEKNQKKKENLTTSSTTSSRVCEEKVDFEILFSWLTDSEDYLQKLAMRNGLLKEGAGAAPTPSNHEALITLFRPYIEEFATLLTLRDEDIYLKGRSDVKSHFVSWLPKYIRAKAALDSPPKVGGVPAGGGSMSRYSNSSTLTPAQLAEQKQQKDRRMADSDALQRHLDEIQREAEQSTDTSAMERVFSKVCKKSNKTTNK